MDLPKNCLLIKTNGTVCGNPLAEGLDRCKSHTTSQACPYPIMGQWCGVALPQKYMNIHPSTDRNHPHNKHYEARTVVVPPEYRTCRVCKKAISSHTGFCESHETYAAQMRREEVLSTLSQLTEDDRKEMIQVLKDMDGLRSRLELVDITDYKPINNPYEELYRLAGQAVKWKDILAERVSTLQELGYEGKTGEQIKAEVQLFASALTECRNILVSISKLDVEERMVRVAEAQALMIAEALGRVLDSLGLDDNTVLRARSGVAERLRLFGGQQAITA